MVEPEGGAVAPGGTVTLTCEVPAQPSPQIHWMKDGVPLPLSPSPVLILPEIGLQDQGTYRCVATHPSHGPQESRAVSISIIGETSLQALQTLGLGCRIAQALISCPILALPPRTSPPLPPCTHTQTSPAPPKFCQESSQASPFFPLN